jgi:hypothetical protein
MPSNEPLLFGEFLGSVTRTVATLRIDPVRTYSISERGSQIHRANGVAMSVETAMACLDGLSL